MILIDDLDCIIESGSEEYITDLYRVLTAEPEDVSEQDEVMYEFQLRNITWTGKLRILNSKDE